MKYKLMPTVDLFAFAKIFGAAAILSLLVFSTQESVKWSSLFRSTLNPSEVEPTSVQLQTIELADALKFYHGNEATFLDVREKQYFDYGRILGAEYLDPLKVNSVSSETLNRWKEKVAVIIYCNGVGCGTSYYVARQLEAKGLDNIKIYAHGWPEWRACQLPMAMSQAMKKEESSNER